MNGMVELGEGQRDREEKERREEQGKRYLDGEAIKGLQRNLVLGKLPGIQMDDPS